MSTGWSSLSPLFSIRINRTVAVLFMTSSWVMCLTLFSIILGFQFFFPLLHNHLFHHSVFLFSLYLVGSFSIIYIYIFLYYFWYFLRSFFILFFVFFLIIYISPFISFSLTFYSPHTLFMVEIFSHSFRPTSMQPYAIYVANQGVALSMLDERKKTKDFNAFLDSVNRF